MSAIREKPEESKGPGDLTPGLGRSPSAAEARIARLRAVLDGVAPGTRIVIRVIAGVLAGRFLEVTHAHVRVALRTGEARIALDGIERIEVMHDPEGKWRGRYSSANDDKGDDT